MCLFSHPTLRENHVYKPVIFYLFDYVSMKPQLPHRGSQQAKKKKKNLFKAFFQRCAQQNHYLYSWPLNLQKPQPKEGYAYLLVLILKCKVNLYIYIMSALHFLKGLINRLVKKKKQNVLQYSVSFSFPLSLPNTGGYHSICTDCSITYKHHFSRTISTYLSSSHEIHEC